MTTLVTKSSRIWDILLKGKDVFLLSLQTPLLNEILVPLIKNSTSTDRSYPSGSVSRRTVVCKLSDVLYIIAQRIGVEQLQQHLTEALQLFFAVFTVSSLSSVPPAVQADAVNSDSERKQVDSCRKGIVLLIILCTHAKQFMCNNAV